MGVFLKVSIENAMMVKSVDSYTSVHMDNFFLSGYDSNMMYMPFFIFTKQKVTFLCQLSEIDYFTQ